MNAKMLFISTISLTFSQLSFSEAQPWIPAPGSLNIGLSYIEQSADEFYIDEDRASLPDDLELSTTFVTINYGINDFLALDARIGYAESNFDALEDSSRSGTTDSNIGLTWQLTDEYASSIPVSSAIRLGAIIGGNYDTGAINAIGDGGNGAELSVAVGKSINPYLSISGEVGIRERSNGIPAETFYNLNTYVTLFDGFSTFLSYRVDDSHDGLQIGEAAFSPDRFPEVEEDKEYIQLGAQYAFTNNISAALTLADVIDGRNTPDSEVYAVSLNYSF